MADKKVAKKESNKQKKGSFYRIEGDSAKKIRKSCPKCGAGVFLADHKDRHTCGNCSYTEWKKGGN